MKRILRILAVLLCVTLLSLIIIFDYSRNNNILEKYSLNNREEQLINLLKNEYNQMSFYTFSSSEGKVVDIWVEIYQGGKVIEKNFLNLSANLSTEKKKQGKIGLMILKDSSYRFMLSFIDDNTNEKVSVTSIPCSYYKNNFSIKELDKPAVIEKEKEYVLFEMSFFDVGVPNENNRKNFIINDSYIYAVKCMFS